MIFLKLTLSRTLQVEAEGIDEKQRKIGIAMALATEAGVEVSAEHARMWQVSKRPHNVYLAARLLVIRLSSIPSEFVLSEC